MKVNEGRTWDTCNPVYVASSPETTISEIRIGREPISDEAIDSLTGKYTGNVFHGNCIMVKLFDGTILGGNIPLAERDLFDYRDIPQRLGADLVARTIGQRIMGFFNSLHDYVEKRNEVQTGR